VNSHVVRLCELYKVKLGKERGEVAEGGEETPHVGRVEGRKGKGTEGGEDGGLENVRQVFETDDAAMDGEGRERRHRGKRAGEVENKVEVVQDEAAEVCGFVISLEVLRRAEGTAVRAPRRAESALRTAAPHCKKLLPTMLFRRTSTR
jgi:hypothetical protein